MTCDVTQASQINAALEQTTSRFGTLHYAFNNAGIEQSNTAIADLNDTDFARILDVDLTGVYLCLKPTNRPSSPPGCSENVIDLRL